MNQADSPPPVPVAIIGMGCLFPKAEDLERYWSNIRDRLDAITEVPETHWRAEDYFDADPKAPDRTYAHRGGFLAPVDFPLLDFGIAPNAIEATDTSQLLGLLVARQALEDAGYGAGGREFSRDRTSVILGVTGTLELVIPLGARLGHPIWRRALAEAGVDRDTADDVVRRIAGSYVGWQEASFPGLLGNVAAGRIANRLDLGGSNCVVDAACASSLGAVNLALHELASGRCDVALSGGLDTFNDIFMYMCFSKTPALSPSGHARPFAAEGDGTTLGEGLGILVLKRLEDAERDGDRIYAVIRSIGSASDGGGQAIYAPKAAGQAKALRRAYQQAGIAPGTVELVEAHGTGTRVGDGIEVEALEEVFRAGGTGARSCALGSVKSQIGHTKAAAGAAGLVKAALALHHKVLPPTIKVDRPLERLAADDSPFYLNTDIRPWLGSADHPRRAAVSAFGFGGSNFHCVLEEARPDRPAVDWGGDVQVLAYAADDARAIEALLPAWTDATTWAQVRTEGARSREAFRADRPLRLLIVAKRGETTPEALIAEARERLSGTLATPTKRIFLGKGEVAGRLAFLFPGQGSQYVGMTRDLACRFPRMLAALELADRETAAALDGTRLSHHIFPAPSFSEERRARDDDALRDTRRAQPAIGAVSLGMLGILEDFGVRPEMTGGHSFGELTALHASGRIDAASLMRLAAERGALMGRCAGGEDAGAMLAAFAPADVLADLIREHALDVVVANKNAPRQCVLSGPAAEIARAEGLLREARVSARRLPVAAAFHSRFVADARRPFRETLDGVVVGPAAIPTFANSTAEPYPDAAAIARDLLADQLARPVEFEAMIGAMHREGARLFVEVGPDSKLSGLVAAILEGRDHACVAIDAARETNGLVGLAVTLAAIAASGRPVDLARWDAGHPSAAPVGKKAGLTVPVCGAHPTPNRPPEPALHAPKPSATPQRASKPTVAIDAAEKPPARNGTLPAPSGPTQPRAPFERTMNAPDRLHLPSSNGNGHAHGLAHPVEPQRESPRPAPAPESAPALQHAHDHLIAFQQLAQQTARLHQQFLEGQETAQRTFQLLLEHQLRPGSFVPSPTAPHPVVEPVRAAARAVESAKPVVVSPPIPARTTVAAPRPEAVKVEARRVEPTPAPMVSVAAPFEASPVAAVLLSVVSEKTGYPEDMLELGMRLDADLGIDSIKRVEILSALQDRLPDAPAVGPDQLGSIHSLGDIVALLGVATPVAAPASAAVPAAAGPDVAAVLLSVVSEKTGYPEDMLELGMRLDADLGIDSIKRVEILSALQDRLPDAPAVGPDQLGSIHSLGDIVALLGVATPVAAPASAAVPAAAGPDVAAVLLSVVSEKTGYPEDMLELGMRLDADLGIDSIKRVEILSALQDRLPDAPAVGPDQLGSIHSLGDIVALLQVGPMIAPAPAAVPRVNSEAAEPSPQPTRLERLAPRPRAVASVDHRERVELAAGAEIWITEDGSPLTPALNAALKERGFKPRVVGPEGLQVTAATPSGLILVAPDRADSDFLKQAFRLIRTVGPGLRGRRASALLTVSRLDGAFGLNGLDPAIEPTSGGLAGLAKTAGREWPEVSCKAVDLDRATSDHADAARRIVEELMRRGPAEIGLSARGTVEIALERVEWTSGNHRRRPVLDRGDLVVITGGARGIAAEAAVALAETYHPALLLLGRTPAPTGPEPAWLAAAGDEAAVRSALLRHATEPTPPPKVNEQARLILARREIAVALDRIRAAGAEAVYEAVDVRDREAVRAAITRAQGRFGHVRGVIHAAGVLADRRIEDQTDAQFDLVYDTKIDGLLSVFEAVDPGDLRAIAAFSSSTARLGRVGQVAYAAANEVLNKWCQAQARRLPECRVVAFNWGPWEGGMVTPSLRTVFEREGVGLIPMAEGAALVARELQESRENPIEIVVLADPPQPGPGRPEGRAEPERVATSGEADAVDAELRPAFERLVDVQAFPVLRSHVIDGHAVLPMALIMEWLCEAAVHRHPGLVVAGLDDFRLFKGVVLRDHKAVPVSLRAGKGEFRDGSWVVPVEMRGRLGEGREVVHARATVTLADRHVEGARTLEESTLFAMDDDREAIYDRVLFHGPAMQALERVEGCDDRMIAARASTSPAPAEWIARPLRREWLTDPLAIDAAFQLMILWCRQMLNANSLPTAVGSYRQFRRRFPAEGVRVVAVIQRATDLTAVADVEFLDDRGGLVARIESYECVVDASLNQAFRRNRLTHHQAVANPR
ncbi:type I polyketide synthase [Paludisphaera mucosa]|uniref:SDR family NAD(P)-dependent oxidoreductase n=1 Tax=Paludisphaera mucosa TaxID=3030827 RepID=A0ABT6FF95_9BACT|nr:type I polyketide synthase [Paludisphaera mucosa]MDG3006241.1 SDR family NAD(P)-dependent oxidoreductase [Paludisphaera mucosa]